MSARLVFVLLGVSGAAMAADPVADISRCAAVADRDARLACYDELGSRYGLTRAAPSAPASASAPATRAASAGGGSPAPGAAPPPAVEAASPSAAAVPSTPAGGRSQAAAAIPPSPAAQPQPAAQPASPAEQRAQFGLQPNQLPKDPEAPKKLTTLEGVVSGFGQAPNGHQVVRIDNAQSWELLQDADPLLAPGQKVSIRRALLGSFIMTTPTGREHRVKRLSQ